MGKRTAIVATVMAVAAALAPSAIARASNHRHHKPRDAAPPVHCDCSRRRRALIRQAMGASARRLRRWTSWTRSCARDRPAACARAPTAARAPGIRSTPTARPAVRSRSRHTPARTRPSAVTSTSRGPTRRCAHLSIDGSNTFYKQVREGTNCRAPVSQPLVIAGRDDVLEYVDYFQSVARLRGNGIGIGFWGGRGTTRSSASRRSTTSASARRMTI